MLKLYGGILSRASIVQWYLEELQIPYEYIQLDMQVEEHKQPEFLAINPMGRLPAIVDEDFQLWESGAILLYLAEKYDTPASFKKRSLLTQWILFGNSTLSSAVLVKQNLHEAPELLTAIDRILQQQPFLTGDRFTVADVAVGSILAYIPIMMRMDVSAYPDVVNDIKQTMTKVDLNLYPAVLDYVQRLAARTAFQKSIGTRGSQKSEVGSRN